MCAINPGFPATSIFYGRDIKARVHVDWGTFSLVAALKELIMSGLEDRLNQKFMLISESGIPLYPGETMWVELMVEEKSRINACELGVCPFIPCLSSCMVWEVVPLWNYPTRCGLHLVLPSILNTGPPGRCQTAWGLLPLLSMPHRGAF